MPDARDFKAVYHYGVAPFDYLEISVSPVSIFGRAGTIGHSVGVMDSRVGQGHRTDLERAEAEAKAVLKAIRAYRRRNAALMQDHEKEEGRTGGR